MDRKPWNRRNAEIRCAARFLHEEMTARDLFQRQLSRGTTDHPVAADSTSFTSMKTIDPLGTYLVAKVDGANLGWSMSILDDSMWLYITLYVFFLLDNYDD